MGTNHRSLGFLLSLGGLPLACAPENPVIPDDLDETTSTGTTGDLLTGDVTGSPTTGFLTSATEVGETGMPPPPPEHPACVAYHDMLLACLPREPEVALYYSVFYCEEPLAHALRLDGQACADLLAAAYVCVSKLSCEVYFGDAPQCQEEAQAALEACPQSLGVLAGP